MDLTGMRWGTSVVVVGAVATATFPWILLDSANFQFFIILYSAFLGPILAVMLADYWILHRQSVDIVSLFDTSPKSAFWFRSGFNPIAFVSMILGTAIALVFLNYSWLVGLFVTLPLYVMLMKIWPSHGSREDKNGRESLNISKPKTMRSVSSGG